jgi:hypothetical protein
MRTGTNVFSRITAVLAAAVLLGLASAAVQAQDAKILVGKWQGDIQQARGRTNSERTLIIETVGEGGSVKGKYGIGDKLGSMQGTAESSGGQILLRFTTSAGSSVLLRLHDERDLIGTIHFRGTGQTLQDIPMRLKKME